MNKQYEKPEVKAFVLKLETLIATSLGVSDKRDDDVIIGEANEQTSDWDNIWK